MVPTSRSLSTRRPWFFMAILASLLILSLVLTAHWPWRKHRPAGKSQSMEASSAWPNANPRISIRT